MKQRLIYRKLGSVRHDQYIPKLRELARFVAAEQGQEFKAFRSHLRGLGIWDREHVVDMLSLVDLSWDRQSVCVGSLCQKIEAAGDDDSVRGLIFERLREENLLLMKYVLGALDVESGGRLHSVHELYRMVTSYVYPGEYITLPDFQAWLDWLAATGAIKIVGIRWALAPRGLSAVDELNAIDVEELMEDWEEARAEQQAEQQAAANVEVTPQVAEDDEHSTPLFPLQESPPQGLERLPADEGEREEFSLELQQPGSVTSHQPARFATEAPVPASGGYEAMSLPVLTGNQAEDVPRIRDWFEHWSSWPEATAQAFDVDTGPEGVEGDALLLELGALAILREGISARPQLFAAIRRLRQAGVFAWLHERDSTLEALMTCVGSLDEYPWFRPFGRRLYDLTRLKQRHLKHPGLYERIARSETARAAHLMLHDSLFGGWYREAGFWVLRECIREGLLPAAGFREVSIVPCSKTLRNAHRLGIIPSADIGDLPRLVEASAAIARYLGVSPYFGLEITYLDRGMNL